MFLTAVLLVAFPFLSCVALAQDSIGIEGASTASAVRGVVTTRVDLQGQSTALAGIPVTLSDSRRAQPLSTLTQLWKLEASLVVGLLTRLRRGGSLPLQASRRFYRRNTC